MSNVFNQGQEGMMNDQQFMQAFSNARWRAIYPAPFFDPIAMQMITDPRILIQWSRYFFEWNPIIHGAIQKMATYPITEFIYDTEDSTIRENYEAAFKAMGLREKLIKASLNYYVCGVNFSTTLMPFTRMVVCGSCGTSFTIDEANLRATQGDIVHTCRKCGETTPAAFSDVPSSDVKDLKLILWNPMNMTIEHDEIMDTHEFYYDLPDYVKNGLKEGKKRYLKEYPLYFFEAAKAGKSLRIYEDQITFIRRETHSASYYTGWGQPLITPALKYLFHLMLLLRAQDAIAIDQILPWTILSPAPSSGVDPIGELDLGTWQDKMKEEYSAYVTNPTRKSIMPLAVNTSIVGGQGKALMLNPEIQEVVNQILAGIGVPHEFIYGGMTWSGSSVSLRMVENQMLNHLTMLQQIIDDVVDKIATYFKYPKIDIRFQAFKMADDVAQKQLLFEMMQGLMISKGRVVQELYPEVDYDKELIRIKNEKLREIELQAEIAKAQQNASRVTGVPIGPQSDQEAAPTENAGDLPEQSPPRAQGGNQQI